jgi:hypothetical protein
VVVLPGSAIVDLASRRVDARRIFDVIRRYVLRAQHRERNRVARVEAAHDDHGVERLVKQFEHRVLSVLCRRTDRVEGPEVGRGIILAEGRGHGLPHLGSDLERFACKHGRLVCHADTQQVRRRIEVRRTSRA